MAVKTGTAKQKPIVKLALTESERTRLKALKAKGEAKLTESEKKELGALRKKITEAAVKATEGGKGYAKPPKVGVGYGKASEGEDEDEQEAEGGEEESEGGKGYSKPPKVGVGYGKASEDEGEDEDEQESEGGEQESEDEDEQESEGRAAESEDEDEQESEGRRESLAEGLRGVMGKLEAYLGEDEDEDEQEAEGGEDEQEDEQEGFKMGEHDPSEPGPGPAPKKKAVAPADPADGGADQGDPDAGDGDMGDPAEGPEDASDPMAVLKDIYKDLMNLAQLLSGGDAGAGDGGQGMPQDEDEGMGKSSPAMRYACASCGETNEVLPPKGFGLMRQTESQKPAQPKSALRESVVRLEKRLAKKESRFMETNRKVKSLIQENAALRGKLAARSRADKAAKMLREARVPADVLSASDLIEFEPGQWAAQIKMAKRVLGQESTGKTGATPRTGSGLKQTKTVESAAKAAIATFEAAEQRD